MGAGVAGAGVAGVGAGGIEHSLLRGIEHSLLGRFFSIIVKCNLPAETFSVKIPNYK